MVSRLIGPRAVGVVAVLGALLASPVSAQKGELFEKPVRLRAAGSVIDAGAAWGHCGPCVADVDGDGKRDLVVGDFSGKFRFFRNTGSDAKPVYAAGKFLRAGGVVAEVRIY